MVGVDDRLGDREAEPAVSFRAGTSPVGAEEPIEDVREILGVDPDARVADLERCLTVGGSRDEIDATVGLIVMDGVGEKIGHDLAEAIGLNGTQWSTQNSNDNIFSTAPVAQRASMLLDFTAVPGTTTGEVQAEWDFISGFTPVEPTYPGGGSLTLAGSVVAGPSGGNPRYKLTLPAYAGYTYEVYGNPTLAELEWKALPFAISQTGSIDRHKHTATAEGTLDLYVEAKADRGFYKVTYRVPGANTGTP